MDGLPTITKIARMLAALAAIGSIVALTACSHAMPGGSSESRSAVDDDDPWITRGSIGVGPVFGNPMGPYSPR
jgi:hypothetical protein